MCEGALLYGPWEQGERKSLERKKGHGPWQSHELLRVRLLPRSHVPSETSATQSHNLLSLRLEAEAHEVFLVSRGRENPLRHSQDTSLPPLRVPLLRNQPLPFLPPPTAHKGHRWSNAPSHRSEQKLRKMPLPFMRWAWKKRVGNPVWREACPPVPSPQPCLENASWRGQGISRCPGLPALLRLSSQVGGLAVQRGSLHNWTPTC